MSARWAAVLLAVVTAGCGESPAPISTSGTAKAALQDALDAWKAGNPATSLAGRTPRIDVIDFEWRAKQTLTDFRIDGDATGQGTQTLAATITLKGKPAKSVKYHVLGSDPIQIYRDEDFGRAMNMDNNPVTKGRPR